MAPRGGEIRGVERSHEARRSLRRAAPRQSEVALWPGARGARAPARPLLVEVEERRPPSRSCSARRCSQILRAPAGGVVRVTKRAAYGSTSLVALCHSPTCSSGSKRGEPHARHADLRSGNEALHSRRLDAVVARRSGRGDEVERCMPPREADSRRRARWRSTVAMTTPYLSIRIASVEVARRLRRRRLAHRSSRRRSELRHGGEVHGATSCGRARTRTGSPVARCERPERPRRRPRARRGSPPRETSGRSSGIGRASRPRPSPQEQSDQPRTILAGDGRGRAVFERDGERCTFTDAAGNRCPATTWLELDHVIPGARGGTSEAGNLRVRCRARQRPPCRADLRQGARRAQDPGTSGSAPARIRIGELPPRCERLGEHGLPSCRSATRARHRARASSGR